MVQNPLENRLEKPLQNPLERMQGIGWSIRERVLPFLEPKPEPEFKPEKQPVVEWKERDDMLSVCVKMGMNAREIRDHSYSWPQGFGTITRVYQRIEELNLKRAYKHAQRKKRNGNHNQTMIYVFSRLSGQALDYGYEVTDVMRDSAPEGQRFRPDLMMSINGTWYLIEVQLSKIEGTRWGVKFRNYLRLYDSHKERMHALFLIDKNEDIPKLRRYAREVLKRHGHENLRSLFLFMTLAQFKHHNDVIGVPVWEGAFHGKPFRLV